MVLAEPAQSFDWLFYEALGHFLVVPYPRFLIVLLRYLIRAQIPLHALTHGFSNLLIGIQCEDFEINDKIV